MLFRSSTYLPLLMQHDEPEPACHGSVSADDREAKLFAALAMHPQHTSGQGAHPLPDRCKLEKLFDWQAVAAELGPPWTPATALQATFGSSNQGILPTRASHGRPGALHESATRQRLGVILVPDFLDEAEESRILQSLRTSREDGGIPWHTRAGGGYGASFGPSYRPNTGYKVDRRVPFTELPDALHSLRTRAEALLRTASGDSEESRSAHALDAGVPRKVADEVGTALRSYAMCEATRSGQQGPLTQAFVQRYRKISQSVASESAPLGSEAVSQALGMHFDSRTENAEVVVGISMGAEPGFIFFSRRGPRKEQAFDIGLARDLESKGEAILLELPRRSLYMFYGFARYHLRHGVPWCCPTAAGAQDDLHFDRITVTFRSVPIPRSQSACTGKDTKRPFAPEQPLQDAKRQCRLEDFMNTCALNGTWLDPGVRRFSKRLNVCRLPPACIDLDDDVGGEVSAG